MYTLIGDKEKNRLIISIKHKIEKDEIKSYAEEIKEIIDDLDFGFTVCADLRQADISVLQNSESFQPIREYGMQKGTKGAVRIMTKEQIELYKSQNFNDPNMIVENEEEAEVFLNSLIMVKK